MLTRALVGCLVPAALMAMSAQAKAAVQIDMSGVFNQDVIVNGTSFETLDFEQAAVDGEDTSFITQRAAEVATGCVEDPDGLPNKGRFAANEDHPLVDLAYDNAKNGRNARRSPGADNYRVSVPRRKYRAIHVFATTGAGDSTMKVKLIYRRVTSVRTFEVQDWFESPGQGYALIDGRDRANPQGEACFDDNGAAIWGFKVKAKSRRALKAVKVIRPDEKGAAVLNVFGMTGVRAGSN